MPKFIKFIHNEEMIILNSENIDCIKFIKKYEIENTELTFSAIKIYNNNGKFVDFIFGDIEDFKQQCDAIMEQLEI